MAPSSPTSFLVVTLSLSFLVSRCSASSFLRSGLVSHEDAENAFESEFAGKASKERLEQLEDTLRSTYKSLPKNAAGNLGHQAVRYVLHRHFVQRKGWYIRGLEPNNDTWHSEASPTSLKEWVPSYLQGLLEKRLGERGTNLHELAVLAAALEDLVRKEAVGRLRTAYGIHRYPLNEAISEQQVDDVARTYFLMYLLAGNVSAEGPQEIARKKEIFAKKYTGYKEAKEWLDGIMADHLSPERDRKLNFSAATGLVADIGERYYTFNDLECRSLKSTLREMEGRKAGRVRLSTFYKMGLYSHWRFNEKADYLRALGALDESDPVQPRVIVPNYVMARTNCLEASHLYGICCRNECEDLMGHLEREIGAEAAEPARIAELVAGLPSDTVAAPRNLSVALVGRLHQVADNHGGRVPLHGRLFAQWMHHAYPRECPYPHEVGTTSPQTPDEWIKETGHTESRASNEEMRQHVESDTCASDAPHSGHGCGEEEDAELPWNEAEELLLVHQPALASASSQPNASGGFADVVLAVVVAAALVAFLAVDYWRAVQRHGSSKEALLWSQQSVSRWLVVLLCVLALVAYCFNLLEGWTLAGAFCVGLAALALRQTAGGLLRGGARAGAAKLPF